MDLRKMNLSGKGFVDLLTKLNERKGAFFEEGKVPQTLKTVLYFLLQTAGDNDHTDTWFKALEDR